MKIQKLVILPDIILKMGLMDIYPQKTYKELQNEQFILTMNLRQ